MSASDQIFTNGTFMLRLDEVTMPRDGEVLTNRWWLTINDHIVIWRRFSPQCNHEFALVDRLIKSNVYKDFPCAAKRIAVAFLGHRMFDTGIYPARGMTVVKPQELLS
jgi:hypothetical protein